MDRLGETELVDAGLKAALQEILDLQGEHVIEPHAAFIEHTDTDETTNERIAFEEALGAVTFVSMRFPMPVLRCTNSFSSRVRS